MLHILYKNTKSCRGTHSRKRRGRNCCCKGKTFIWIVQGIRGKSAEMEVVFNRCWVFRDAKCGIYKPKLGIYTPRGMGRGTLVHSLGSMNLSPMILYQVHYDDTECFVQTVPCHYTRRTEGWVWAFVRDSGAHQWSSKSKEPHSKVYILT